MTSTSLFPSRSTSLSTLRDGATPGELVRQAGEVGGWRARLRVRSVVNAESVALVAEAVRAHFAAKREELAYRAELLLDSAKKRIVADQMTEIAHIEREIMRMTQEAMRDVNAAKSDEALAAALDETRRVRELTAALQRGEITQRRYEAEARRLERATDDIVEKLEAFGARVMDNLGVRLDRALSPAER